MQKRVIRTGTQPLYQIEKLTAMLAREHRGTLDESCMVYDVKHLLVQSRRGTLLRL